MCINMRKTGQKFGQNLGGLWGKLGCKEDQV